MEQYQKDILLNLAQRLRDHHKENTAFSSRKLIDIAVSGKTHLRKTLGNFPSGKDRLRHLGTMAIRILLKQGYLDYVGYRTYTLVKLPNVPPNPNTTRSGLFEDYIDFYDLSLNVDATDEASAELMEDDCIEAVFKEADTEETFEDGLQTLKTLVKNEALNAVLDTLEQHNLHLTDVVCMAENAISEFNQRKDAPVLVSFESLNQRLEELAEVRANISRLKTHFSR